MKKRLRDMLPLLMRALSAMMAFHCVENDDRIYEKLRIGIFQSFFIALFLHISSFFHSFRKTHRDRVVDFG